MGTSIALRDATYEDFAPLVGKSLNVSLEEGGEVIVEVTLCEVQVGKESMPGGRTSFSLFFDGPGHVALPQQIYWLSEPGSESIGIFLVPVSGDASNRRYQAVFN